MYEVKKRFEISAAHKLDLDYDSKCTNFHGHNWIIDVYLQSETLDKNGMVLDFTHIKRKIQDKFDHKVINEVVPFNPTAENLAKYICDELAPFCYRVDVQESQDNIASYIKDDVKIKLLRKIKMKVIEIFDSIDGEGIRTGQCATFIRLAGCNLRCSYCDTVYSLFGEETPCEYTEMTVDEIISKVNMTYKRVTLTGGEPLVHTDSAELVLKLTEIGCDVNIETNGAVDIVDFLGKVPKSDNLFFTIDYKLPSSGMTDKMIWNNFINLRPCDVIKFVIGSDEDMNLTIDIVKKLKQVYTEMPHIYLGAVYGMYDAQKLVNIMLKEPVLCDATFQIQLHKVIWDPEERGV